MGASARGADFTPALFLGEHHPSEGLSPWSHLTTGVPAVLGESATAVRLATTVARRQGAEAGLAERSALHGLMDVLAVFPGPGGTLWVDDAAYPLARWACLVARARGVPVHVFPHHRPPPRVPAGSWLVTDGWCQGCGRPAPLGRLVALAAGTGGRVLVDDSLAFGVLGARRPGTGPFGDGTGTVRRLGLGHDGVVWLASLAKAHGTPVTVITGDRGTIAEVARRGGHRTHSSPPSQADLTAGLDSLARAPELDLRRRRLYRLTLRLRDGFRDAGLEPQGPPFPIVASRLDTAAEAHGILAALARDGFRALIQVPRCRPGYLLAVVVRADHRAAEVEGLVHSLRRAAVGRRAA